MGVNIFFATTLVLTGICILLYTVLPSSAWSGVLLSCFGFSLILSEYNSQLKSSGLKSFLPKFVNDFLERNDFFDVFIHKLRDNAFMSKMSRLLVVKWIDVSRHEAADILEGVWPGFRGLSEDVSLLDLTPRWFKSLYSPRKQFADQVLETDEFVLDEPLQHCVVPKKKKSDDVTPLVLWLLEKRIRLGMTEGLPVARRLTFRTVIPLLTLVLLWRKYPRARRPMMGAGLALMLVYVISITRGLPGGSERVFQALSFSWYKRRGERQFNSDQTNGSMKAVLYALVEPFVPQVNSNVCRKKLVHARSPALSQASTEDPNFRS